MVGFDKFWKIITAGLACVSMNAMAGEMPEPQRHGYSTTSPKATYSTKSNKRAPVAVVPGNVAARPHDCADNTTRARGRRSPTRELVLDIETRKRRGRHLPRGLPVGEIAVDLDTGETTIKGVPSLKKRPRSRC